MGRRLTDRPPAAEVLAELDRQFVAGPSCSLHTVNASTEARILYSFLSTAPASLGSTCSTRCA